MLYGHSAEVAAWVAERIPALSDGADFGPCAAIGVVRAGELVAGCVFHNFQPNFGKVEFSFAADTPRWATIAATREFMRYPFVQLGVGMIWAAVRADNRRVLKLADGMGFQRAPGEQRHYFGTDKPAVIVSMTRDEWLSRHERVN